LVSYLVSLGKTPEQVLNQDCIEVLRNDYDNSLLFQERYQTRIEQPR
jgi:hypothetical protein